MGSLFKTSVDFKTYPASVKRAIVFLAAGWLLHYAYYFMFFAGADPSRTVYLQLFVGVGICWFVAGINRWARTLCLFFNIGIIVLYLFYFAVYLQVGKSDHSVFTALVVVAFGLSTYYLLQKETTRFFLESNRD
jgi:hypothetical protein